MDQHFWGPSAWVYLHTIAHNYPQQPSSYKRNIYRDVFTNLKYTLPCRKCRKHWCKLLRKFPIDPFLKTRDTLTLWLFMAHDMINRRLGNGVSPHFKDVVNIYNHIRAGKKEEPEPHYRQAALDGGSATEQTQPREAVPSYRFKIV